MMNELIKRFPNQLKEAIEIGQNFTFNPHNHPINKVFVAGMGGSGIGGDFVAEIISQECKVPYLIGKSYDIPTYIDENTLAIISSYSGNTEETLSAFEKIMGTGAKIICIASGGKVIQKAKEMKLDYMIVPGNWPSPRACLGYSIIGQLSVIHKMGLIGDESLKNVQSAINLIQFDQEDIEKKGEKIAKKIKGSIPIIYTTDKMESVAVRMRQQINENAKQLCWHHVLPEMNHNELVGWKKHQSCVSAIFLRNKDDYHRNQKRIEITKGIISNLCDTVLEVYSKGNSLVEKMFYLVHLGDWVSWYLSIYNEVDSIEVDVIDYLKGELAKI